MTVLIAGAGIAGLTLGLTLHQIGVRFRIYEAVDTIGPLGVGINIQPNAVRELYDLGLEEALERCGIRTKEYGFFTRTGREIWTEPRGTWAGYNWPQYSVHRGRLQMELLSALMERAGEDVIVTGHRATGFENRGLDEADLHLETKDGRTSACGSLIVAADGINSTLRAQMVPHEGDPVWNGAVLWRAISRGKGFRTGASMILAGNDKIRFVAYPITEPDPDTGEATINWIAETWRDPAQGWRALNWTRGVDIGTFLPAFEDWDFGWLDVPGLIKGADKVFEYPMIDRDPLDRWTQGRVTLMGDAAHPAYPVGSNGASQAIIDARLLGSKFQQHGLTPKALQAYEEIVRPQMKAVVLANRGGGGPDGVMQMFEDRCGGNFDTKDDVISRDELAAHAQKYKAMAGFSIEELNARPPLIDI